MLRRHDNNRTEGGSRSRRRRGFSLVEVGLVVLIVALVVGGVLGGQVLLKNIRISSTIETIRAVDTAMREYRRMYRTLPGDDREATARFGATVPQASGAADGVLDGSYNSSTPDQETRVAWAHLRAAGLVEGAGSDQEQPNNRFGGIFGLVDSPLGLKGPALCVSNIPGDAAEVILNKLDDGQRATGGMRAIKLTGISPNLAGEPEPGPIPSADEDQPHIVCDRL